MHIICMIIHFWRLKMGEKKIVLAYSGGLDTSVILKWLCRKGYDVVCFVGNVGQNENFREIELKALQTGASKVYVEDLRREFVTDYIFPALSANVVYENNYLLGTALARPILAKRQVEIAMAEGTSLVSHGSTGKGNDQVRFELGYYGMNPDITIYSPWKDPEFLAQFKGRTDMINYAREWQIPVQTTARKPYSIDANLFHISHESGILEDPGMVPPADSFSGTVAPFLAPDEETVVRISFKNGIPVSVFNERDGILKTDPLEMFEYLNEMGASNGIGRIDIVENRFVGIKSRGIYETPGGTILWAAHKDLEYLVQDREVLRIRDSLVPKFADIIYNGFWFSPEAEFLISVFSLCQGNVNGSVTLSLYKGNVMVIGRESINSLYSQDLSSMEIEGGYNAVDAKGFININAIRLKAYHYQQQTGAIYEQKKENIIKQNLAAK